MKRRASLLAMFTAGALALSACAFGGTTGNPPAGGGETTPAATSTGPVTGEITIWSWDVAAVALERLAAEYQKEHDGVTINVTDIGYDNAYDKISVGMQAGTGLPDIITLETDRSPGYITGFPNALTDLTPSLGDDKADFDPFKWAAGSDADGKLRVAPWDSGPVGLFFRADYFKDAGIDPASIKTWDELVDAGVTIKEKTGHTLISTGLTGSGLFQMLLQQQGQGLFDAAGDITFSTPEAVQVLTLIKSMNDKGLIKNVKGWDARVTSAKDGDSAVTPEAVWWIGTLEGEAPELSGKYGVRDLPVFSDGGARTSNSGGSGLAVPTQAKNPALATDFVKYVLANKDNQASMMKNEGLFPSYLPALQTPFFQEPSEYFGGEKVYELFATLTGEIPEISFSADSSQASDLLGNTVSQVVLNGADPKQALDDAAKQLANATGRKIAG